MKNINELLKNTFDNLAKSDIHTINTQMIEQMNTEWYLHDRGGVYGIIQRDMAYNSNRIEGSHLTKDETASLFETGQIISDGLVVYRSKDIEEMSGHFLMFNKMLQTIDKPLSEDLIKAFHYELTSGVFEFRTNGYPSGEYKTRANMVSTITVALPNEVPEKMKLLLSSYQAKIDSHSVTLEDLAKLHADFEKIHPFQDGNGRTGRMILFREALKNDFIPFIIHDNNKLIYANALKEYQQGGSIDNLTSYFQSEQENFYKNIAVQFLYDYSLDDYSTEQDLNYGE